MKEVIFDKGLSEEKVLEISKIKNEPKWMSDFRVKAYKEFIKQDLPKFGPKIDIDFDNITYYKKVNNKVHNSWNDIDKNVTKTFNDLGVIDQEKTYLDGLGVQYESEAIYHNMIKELEEKNVIFLDTDTALKKHPDLFKKYFNELVKYDENKFTALNGAVWSGGTFIYVPPFTKLDRPLQSYFRINTKDMGQFERSLIIVDHDSEVHYIEGCTAPTYTSDSLHAAVVEIYVGKNSKCRYTTIQNWANNINNLVTKRAVVEENGLMQWIDGNIGSKLNMKYPSCILKGDNSKGECISIAMASEGQIQDTGAKMIHIGKNTQSKIIAKSIARDNGNASYRGKVSIEENAINSKSSIKCDTILLDPYSKSDTIPTNICKNDSSTIEHEATVSKIDEEKLFYMQTRGIDEEKAIELSIIGFIEEFTEELPLEYAVELNNLLKNNFKPLCEI
ncbi:MAG: Fe-S cluster assembly protein SufB [Bacilli bacterium]|nr:Fe-S cluster assembly protein SufB [Bacilli bacterium]